MNDAGRSQGLAHLVGLAIVLPAHQIPANADPLRQALTQALHDQPCHRSAPTQAPQVGEPERDQRTARDRGA